MTKTRIYSTNIIYSVLLLQLKGFYWGFIFTRKSVALMTNAKTFLKYELTRLYVSGKNQGWSNLFGLFFYQSSFRKSFEKGELSERCTGMQIEKWKDIFFCKQIWRVDRSPWIKKTALLSQPQQLYYLALHWQSIKMHQHLCQLSF